MVQTYKRGIRQGDPISPYLFVLCMERLGHVINQTVLEGRWKPLRLSRNGSPLSYLIFANDLLLFSKASKGHIQVIMECMNMFCAAMGKKISLKKSGIALLAGVDEEKEQKISRVLGISMKAQLKKYLRVPSIMGRTNLGPFQHLLNRIESRLEG